MKRLPLVLVLAASLVAFARSRAECPLPGAERSGGPVAAEHPFSVHEWGVWRLGPNGRVASLEELARESPSFVHRAPDAPGPELGPAMQAMPVACEKPVIFFHGSAAQEVHVTVQFPRGRPWLYFPDATIGRTAGVRSVRFSGHVLPEGVAMGSSARPLPAVDAAHWWSRLRSVNASAFVAEGSAEAEQFVFYDGEVAFAPGFRFARGRLSPIPGRTEAVAWTWDAHAAARLAMSGASTTSSPIASVDALRADIHAAPVSRGLTGPEAESLLATWHGNLFTGTARRVIWLLPRAAYDAMLPIDVRPLPTAIVRVGVVIQQY